MIVNVRLVIVSICSIFAANSTSQSTSKCTYWTCFDAALCAREVDYKPLHRLRIYVGDDANANWSWEFDEMVKGIRMSAYFVHDPTQACVFMPNWDFLNNSVSNEGIGMLNSLKHLLVVMLTTDRLSTTVPSKLDILLTDTRHSDFHELRSIVILQPPTATSSTWHALTSPTEYDPLVSDFLANEASVLDSTLFCLIYDELDPVGRLHLFNAMAHGCIPVIGDDAIVLPFFEVLDWSKIAIRTRLSQLGQIPSMLASYSTSNIQMLQGQVEQIFDRYFSSLTKIVHTTLDILNDRIYPYYAKSYAEWNDPDYLNTLFPYPPVLFYPLIVSPASQFTVLIKVKHHFNLVYQLLMKLDKFDFVRRVVVVWSNKYIAAPNLHLWPSLTFQITVIDWINGSTNTLFYPHMKIDTEGVFFINDNTCLPPLHAIREAFKLWCQYPDRLVGLSDMENASRRPRIFNVKEKLFSAVYSATFFHKYYLQIYWELLSPVVHNFLDRLECCQQLFLNWIIMQTSFQSALNVHYTLGDGHDNDDNGCLPFATDCPNHLNQVERFLDVNISNLVFRPFEWSTFYVEPV